MNLKKEETLEIQRFFLLLDIDDSGTLDKDELLQGLTNMYGPSMANFES